MFSPNFDIEKSSSKLAERQSFLSIIKKIGKHKKVTKGEAIIRSGSGASYFFYIEKGIFQTSTTINEKKYVLGFTFPGDVDGCPTALLENQQNNFLIEAVVNSEVLVCDMADFRKECKESEFFKIILTILSHYLPVIEKRLIDSLSLTAEKRYKQLLTEQPEKIKQIPLTLIAAYLGISLERLSRIRSKINS
jgi:CRP/FNR family transcriptional regulator, anaerobic regulatory protein